ncbi:MULTISPECIES: type II secretion system protein GspM [unclassified Psychrobacter]|uniref:type II secretion system protein GspM n=1 Tax=unclassified Psychrobacter TaxID=196806 RepID=UPI0025B43141|nr:MULTISPECIES: type II secretion system protein GspM [unclassified Psychrobacter]MDN3452972.1 type II secretion system protein GspM [Psychrobacter sp. APC 3350]MDN3501507.1 type II secretion system protein GspM [Psychrobacter sp. 5A.1]
MKRLQRRTKRNTAVSATSTNTPAFSERVSRYQNVLATRWQGLPPRDQLALGILSMFLLLFIGGYGGYSVHQAASDSKSNYQEQVADYFWLRAQAGNIDSNTSSAGSAVNGKADMPPANRISALLNNAGITEAQVVAAGDSIQLSFTHPSQAVVSAALGKLEQQGWQFTQLSMQQDITNKSIQVQATVTS